MTIACSFLPAATHMIQEMGLENMLHGVTFECPSDRPRVVRSRLEGEAHSSAEIDRIVADYVRRGESLYYIDMELLARIAPDVIFTQHVCDVCQIGTAVVEQAVAALPKPPSLVPLVPTRLADVYENVLTVGRALGHEAAARRLVARGRARTDAIGATLRAAKAPTRRAMLIEWPDPIYHCGHWVPDQIALAGAIDELGNPGGHSAAIPWERVVQYDPEVLVIAPCGFSAERALAEAAVLQGRPGWHDLRAVRSGRVYVADGNFFTQPSTTLVDGVELLASLFHPALFERRAGAMQLI